MKRLLVTAIVGTLAISLSVFEIAYINNSTNEIKDEIDKAIIEYKEGNLASARLLTEKSFENWENKKPILDMFLYHETVDEIGMGLTIAKEHLKINSNEYIISCEMIKENLTFIKRAEYPIIENIL